MNPIDCLNKDVEILYNGEDPDPNEYVAWFIRSAK
jgi:hypothetical protein